jgi:hypothetical protein
MKLAEPMINLVRTIRQYLLIYDQLVLLHLDHVGMPLTEPFEPLVANMVWKTLLAKQYRHEGAHLARVWGAPTGFFGYYPLADLFFGLLR